MTHLETIREAYDKCGIHYAVIVEDEYTYLVLVADVNDKKRFEGMSSSQAVSLGGPFIEFENGKIASY